MLLCVCLCIWMLTCVLLTRCNIQLNSRDTQSANIFRICLSLLSLRRCRSKPSTLLFIYFCFCFLFRFFSPPARELFSSQICTQHLQNETKSSTRCRVCICVNVMCRYIFSIPLHYFFWTSITTVWKINYFSFLCHKFRLIGLTHIFKCIVYKWKFTESGGL